MGEARGLIGKRSVTAVAVLMLTSVFVGGVAGAAGSTSNVCPSGCAYTSIQDAIDDAGPGDTIAIQAGTYVESLSIPASKPGLTLSGAGEDDVTVDASGSPAYGLEIAADDVTVEGLTILGPDNAYYGIHAGDTPEDLTGLTIQQTTVRESASTEIDLHAVQDATVSDVELIGAGTGGNGLSVTDSHDVTVEDVTSTGNTWGGFAIYTSGKFVEPGTSGITLTGDNSLGEANPVYVQVHEATVTDLDIQGHPIELTYGNNEAYTFLQPDLGSALDAAVAFADGDDRFDVDTAVVEDTRDGSHHAADGMSLQAAIEAAGPDGDVTAHGGTYDEALAIDADGLTVTGEEGATLENGVSVAGDDVTLASLAIEDPRHHGITAGDTIEDLTLDDVEVSQASSALRVANHHGLDGLTITDSTFEDNKFGIYFAHQPVQNTGIEPVSDVLIEDTDFLDSQRKGIYVETLDEATLRNVTVSGVTSPTHGFNNGIDINLKDGDYRNITIVNTVVEDVAEGEPFQGEDAFASAIAIKARDDGSFYGRAPATLDGVTLHNVTVRDSVNGLRIGEPGVDYSTFDAPTNVTVQASSFGNLDGFGLSHLGEEVVDASHNWWNATTGPTVNDVTSPLTGERIEGAVDFAPFCLVASCMANSAVHGLPTPHVALGSGFVPSS